MQSLFLLTAYATDSPEVIYIFYWLQVKVNTQRSKIHRDWLLTDDIISENWHMPGLLTGNYYASLGNKLA